MIMEKEEKFKSQQNEVRLDGNCLLRAFSAILFEVQRTIKS